jgi:hypothetical protein
MRNFKNLFFLNPHIVHMLMYTFRFIFVYHVSQVRQLDHQYLE